MHLGNSKLYFVAKGSSFPKRSTHIHHNFLYLYVKARKTLRNLKTKPLVFAENFPPRWYNYFNISIKKFKKKNGLILIQIVIKELCKIFTIEREKISSVYFIGNLSTKKFFTFPSIESLIKSQNQLVTFPIFFHIQILPPPGSNIVKGDCVATVQAPSKTKINARITHEAANGAMRIEFVPNEVGTHIIEASIGGTKLVGGPLVAKVYDTGLIQVTEVNGGVVGQPCQFRGKNDFVVQINYA